MEDYDRIFELGKNLQLVILDCDLINNPSQLEKSGLMPIMIFIKISDPEVLKRLIRTIPKIKTGKTKGGKIESMGIQCLAAEKLCQCDPVSPYIIAFKLNPTLAGGLCEDNKP